MKIYIGADHAGYKLKEELEKYLKSKKHQVIDVGAHRYNKKDDYPAYAARVGRAVRRDKKSRGILICGNAEGVCIVANKIRGVRAAVGYSEYAAKTSRTDDNANILCLAGRVLKPAQAKKIVHKFLTTPFSSAPRHRRRLKKLEEIEKGSLPRLEAEIIPAILAKDAIEFAQKARLVESVVKTAQIDIMDKKFVRFESWADPTVIKTIPTPLKYELHLMVRDPDAEIKKFKNIENVIRAIFHIEVKKNHVALVRAIKKNNWQAGVAINPGTSIKRLEKILPLVDLVLFLGVTPGKSGQKFQKSILKKITRLRKIDPRVKISVDGGVNLKNAPQILAAGADSLCAASSIYKSKNIKKTINEFKKLKNN